MLILRPAALRAYLHVASGVAPRLNGLILADGDGVKIADESLLTPSAESAAEALLFDLP